MTTRLLILNLGPDPISVVTNSDSKKILLPQNSSEFYVHAHQSLEITELKEPQLSENYDYRIM